MTDHDIDQQYKQQATEMPPISVDNKITQMAQQSVRKKPISAFKRYAPLSLVASIALVSILVLYFPQTYQQPPIIQEPSAPTAITASSNENAADENMIIHEIKASQPEVLIPPPMEKKQFHSVRSTQKARLSKREMAKMEFIAKQQAHDIAEIRNLLKQKELNAAMQAAKNFEKRFGKDALPKELHYLIAKPDK
ncbi:hypothetical protein MHM98_16330 [Psychrobium sp. MM17-31]|uniref:hypothetical protein n=1 Tax=Psychrobium sp. MM17-31 TaxID=2917758 RepID=UPI001EF4B013|nr:hypothetical protein [Psychrobium sp. MM17-31]MCG7532900.1 hypothetical protein [Psychrobium sp. MM17-31]